MFSLFPCDWQLPRVSSGLFVSKKKIHRIRKSVALNPEQLTVLNKNAVNSEPLESVKFTPPNKSFVDYDLREEAKKFMPADERCISKDINNSNVDEMLAGMNNDSSEVKTRQMMKMMTVINENLDKNIKTLQNSPTVDGDKVSKKDLLKLLKVFANYSHALEDYFNKMSPANCVKMVIDEQSVGMKYLDISEAKILLIQIPEKLYLRDGYRSLEQMMETLRESGIIVVAVPESVNLVNITEKDLKKLDLFKINKIKNEEL